MPHAASKHVRFNDGQLADAAEYDAIPDLFDAFLQELLERQHGDTDFAATARATIAGAKDVVGADVPSYGFFGPSLRVYKVDATTIKLLPGLGLQHDATTTDGWPVLVIRLGSDAVEVTGGIVLTNLPSSGQYKRALVLTCPRTVTTDAVAQVMDSSGNVASATVPGRSFPEVGAPAGIATNIVVQYGTAASTAAGAARPAGLPGYVALAELLLDSTGLSGAANVDGVTPGITDLRPRLRTSKAGGGVDARRATCSMDETTASRNTRRIGAKAVGEDVVRGFVQIPTSSGVVTLDTSRDWRDMMVEIELGALVGVAVLPGGSSDTSSSYASNPSSASSSLARVTFFSGSGSTAGASGYYSAASKTAADGSSTSLTFFADITTGALKCLGVAHTSGVQELYFRATGFGPLGKRPASGVES